MNDHLVPQPIGMTVTIEYCNSIGLKGDKTQARNVSSVNIGESITQTKKRVKELFNE